jgi:hypothetical protein
MLRHSTSNNLDPKDKNLPFHNTDTEPIPARSHFSTVVREVVGRFFRKSKAKRENLPHANLHCPFFGAQN